MNPRLFDERQYHDRQAADRALTFTQFPQRLRFLDSEYLDHASWIRPALKQLGDMDGKRILDLGSGHGMASVVMARRGATVTACDLSPGYCAEARHRAAANECPIQVVACNGEQLPFADQSFDAIWGHAILHHLNVSSAAQEMRRVLKLGGRAVLCEPWNGNPMWRIIRRLRNHTHHERPLSSVDVDSLRKWFGQVSVTPFQFWRYVILALE